ncbi:hypothetical protein [Staphylococcus hyicus]|uniref:hypothetical protein n=1 Tax=Staphylococcus hyicus TaxID=1284 RepID=UPI00211C690E|nr:hypothetical protein [Staphylococcus hyicus]MCQ9290700.1 hypothetical protein [Staphylococcus hyicus]MCQ9305942.1 hypothetical protein [Staphylococcus hyicus]MCQ9308354.1 hypothetical protein [Staphylococcus hyicus]MCQ9310776.1 hypothetical protein [Staphylococcus hyicus]
MKPYTFNRGRVAYDGKIFNQGEVVYLDEEQAKLINHLLNPRDDNDSVKAELETHQINNQDYESLTVSELKQLVEDRGLEVVQTGKNRILKSDYIRALTK